MGILRRMKLESYLSQQNLTASAFADQVGVAQSTISRLMAGVNKKNARNPSWKLMMKIRAVTHGEVTPNDFITEDDVSDHQ